MLQPYRNYSVGNEYRYGFNGKEKDNDIQNSDYDYGFRIYNPCLGRFLSIDPLSQKYPELTPYQYASNMPIIAIDLDGEEGKIVTIYHSQYNGKEFYREVKDDNSAFATVFCITTTIHKYPVSTVSGKIEYRQTGAAELTFNSPVNFQIGRIDLTNQTLGRLSEQYESQGVGTVSSGKGDAGGVSYGNWQLASRRNRPSEFLQSEGKQWAAEFGDAEQGTKEFSKIWKQIAKRDPTTFKEAQHSYIKRTHYDVMVSRTQRNVGLNINSRSSTLQDVAWSTAVQHGPNNSIFERALAGKDINKLSDADIIKLVYAERGRKNNDGTLAYFKNNSKKTQKSVSDRFINEMNDALKQLQTVKK